MQTHHPESEPSLLEKRPPPRLDHKRRAQSNFFAASGGIQPLNSGLGA